MSAREGVEWADTTLPGDHELWAAVQDGDRSAFTTLYHRHVDPLWRQARYLTGSLAMAEDVLAATFLTAWRRRGEIRLSAESALPWLLAVVGNEARTERRTLLRHRRLAHRVGPAPAVGDHSDAVAAAVDDDRRVHRVLAALERLPAAQREVVELCVVADLPQADAARVLGIPEATVRTRIHRARARLRVLLPEETR